MESDVIPVQSLWSKLDGYNCFGCAPHNDIGLNLSFHECGAGVRSPFNLSHSYSSYPKVAHGGIVATVLDEVMGNVLVIKGKRLCFTLSLSLRYLAPVIIGIDYYAYAEIKDLNGDFAQVEGGIYDQEDNLLVRARGTYKTILPDEATKIMDVDKSALKEFPFFRDE